MFDISNAIIILWLEFLNIFFNLLLQQWFFSRHFVQTKKTKTHLMISWCTGIHQQTLLMYCVHLFHCCGRLRTDIDSKFPLQTTDRSLSVSPRSSAKYEPGKCLLFSWEKTTLCPKIKGTPLLKAMFFHPRFSTLIEFFNNAHLQKRR